MKLEELKQGDTFYKVTISDITRYEYLMLYPFHNPINVKSKGYHIVIMKSLDEPKRMYYTEIEKIIEQGAYDYESAKALQILLVEKHLAYLKSRT